ncbi:TIGR03758 family integrating conjugative element protein [Shewanella colwelliana]|uniref:TIGR03758 family integrating conjugative element protein n=1 Tax=Shewanella colwelliana TaxID=23 RepID=UPI0037354893
MKEALDAFEHGAGFSTHDLAVLIAVIGMIIMTVWVIWVAWSVFRGLKAEKTDKSKLLHAMSRTMLIWLFVNYILVSGIY